MICWENGKIDKKKNKQQNDTQNKNVDNEQI